jgi:radical SAM superfamily enzyme YgiQ (UPF0313 family)
MRILFAVKSKKMETLGVMYLSAVVKQAGHESRIVTFDQVEEVGKLWLPDIIGFSVMTGDEGKVIMAARNLKTWWPKEKSVPTVIVGGPHPTFYPQDFENQTGIHIVARGEWESQILKLLLQLPYLYPTIDSMPFPDRTDFPDMVIRDFITSRGCRFSCTYCYNKRWSELFPEIERVRMRSVDNVIAEIKTVMPQFVYFQDSCFGISKKWLREFKAKYRMEIHIPFHCHLRPNQINEEKAILLAEAGCYSARIALESASPRLRNMINRDMSNATVYDAVRLLKKWGIKVMIQSILALPTSKIEDDLQTLQMNIRMKPDYAWCSIFVPYPGTELGDLCKEKGWYKGNYGDISDCFFDRSVLEFDEQYKEQTYVLQKVFALCAEAGYLPEKGELEAGNIPNLVHKIMRVMGDRRLYGGLI